MANESEHATISIGESAERERISPKNGSPSILYVSSQYNYALEQKSGSQSGEVLLEDEEDAAS